MNGFEFGGKIIYLATVQSFFLRSKSETLRVRVQVKDNCGIFFFLPWRIAEEMRKIPEMIRSKKSTALCDRINVDTSVKDDCLVERGLEYY